MICLWKPQLKKCASASRKKLFKIQRAEFSGRVCGFSKYHIQSQQKETDLYNDTSALFLPFSTELKVYMRGRNNLGILELNELSQLVPQVPAADIPQAIIGEVLLEDGQKKPIWGIQLPLQYSQILEKDGNFSHWRSSFSILPQEEIKLLTIGRALLLHQETFTFCPRCGSRLKNGEAGSTRVCPSEPCSRYYSWYPSVPPVIITLISHGDECLLVRTHKYTPKMYTCVAGFLESGETIEECVKREIKEEVGMDIKKIVKYEFSQSWPTESATNLMLACTVQAENKNFQLDTIEMEDAKWFSKTEVRRMLNQEPCEYTVPNHVTSAHRLLTQWVSS